MVSEVNKKVVQLKDGSWGYERPDFSEWPMEIIRGFSIKLQGDKEPRYCSDFPKFVDLSYNFAFNNKWFESPAEQCLLESMEFARRYPNHLYSKERRNGFTNAEILQISKGKKKIIFKYYDHSKYDEYYKSTRYKKLIGQIKGIFKSPDFTEEPMYLRKTYEYWLEGDIAGKPRGSVEIPQFKNILSELAINNKWVVDDCEYSLIAELEFCRRNPNHKYSRHNDFYKLFSKVEVSDISRGKRKLIFKCSDD